MPIIASAKKAARQNIRRRARNAARKAAYKDALRAYRKLAASGKIAEAKALLPTTYRALDKAAKTGALKPNTASRLKSRLARLLQKKS
jgi:small subunit ribosomal protein S20